MVRSQTQEQPTPYTRPGEYTTLESRVRSQLHGADIPTLFVYAFDYRTRLGPFVFIDKQLIPGSAQAIPAALDAVGLHNLRVVLQQWCPNVKPSQARLGGIPPQLLLISCMQIHSRSAYRLIEDAWQLGDQRPLIVVGGPKAIFEPWDLLSLPGKRRVGADVAVTGEEYVLLKLLDMILEHKSPARDLARRVPASAATAATARHCGPDVS